MPVPVLSTVSPGPVVANSVAGNAPRALGGVVDAPLLYTDFGLVAWITDPANVFNPGTTVSLASVNLPAYSFALGTVLRLSFTGFVTWDLVAGAGEAIQIGLRFAPTAAALSQVINLGPPVLSSGIAARQVFSGQLTLFARTDPSGDADVAIHMVYASIANSGVASPVVIVPLTPAVKANGIIGLMTVGWLTGTDISVVASMPNTGAGASVRVIQLIECVTEMTG